jgi:hypothetical protein
MAESPLSLNALEYTFRHLLKVAFPHLESEPFRVEKGNGNIKVFLKDVRLVIYTIDRKKTGSLLAGRRFLSLRVYNVKQTLKIPLLFDGCKYAVCSDAENSIYIPFDIITISFLLLSRYEEYLAEGRDEHGRFQYKGSLVEKYKLIEIPLVDEYAMLLRRWLCLYFPDSFQAISRPQRIVPTHDIDILRRFTSRWQALKSIFGRDLLINRSLSMVKESMEWYRDWKDSSFMDPYVDAILEFLDWEMDWNLHPFFFFKATDEDHPDATYDWQDPILQEIIRVVMSRGGQIGLHGSYPSAEDVQCLQKEKQNLSKLCGKAVSISRQHYLRAFFADDPNPLDLWRQVGITDDYTLGFAERCGFRCGTCHPYPLYDVRNDCVTNIIEHPLIVMDGTLFDYMKLPVEKAKKLAMKLKKRCFDVEGDFVILWHNHATTREFKPYYENVYLPLIEQ